MEVRAGEFSGKIVLVTGAGRGVGRMIANTFADQGAWIACNDLLPTNLDQTVDEIRDRGGVAIDFVYDVARRLPVRAMVDEILTTWGRIDILVNSASVKPKAKLLEMDEWDWQRTIDVNLSAPFHTTQIVGRIMQEQSGGTIINLAVSPEPTHNLEGRAGYYASKTGLLGLTRAAAFELAPFHIRINAIWCGVTEPIVQTQKIDQKKLLEKYLPESSDLDRAHHDREIAGLALYLASEAARHINGQIIEVTEHRIA